MRIIEINNNKDLERIFKEIRVDPYGIKIMSLKAKPYLIRINNLPCILANILKQEMLSLGGDTAIARESLTGKIKKTDCLLIGNLAQFRRLNEKLNLQPFGLKEIGKNLIQAFKNYEKDNFVLKLDRYKLNLSRRSHIMGIINLTPDSFSGDGLYGRVKNIVEYAEQLIRDGADIIDIGGESSRPGAKPVGLKEELNRVIPAIKDLAKKIKTPISIDTYKPEVAEAALKNGASIVNDITGLKNDRMLKVISKNKSGAVAMHMKSNPRVMQKNPVYNNLVDEIIDYLTQTIDRAKQAGINQDKLIIDPGIGFGKTLEHNLEILKRLNEFKILGQPILVGPSRKSFIGKVLRTKPEERIFGTVASCVLACHNGANIVRVHDVKAVSQALKIADTINNNALENYN